MGKSMRAKRLQAILCKGWVANSGSASVRWQDSNAPSVGTNWP